MKFLATKNTYKNEDKDPDFNIYLKDKDNEIIQGEYTKQDGTTGIGWKKFGAIWHNVENGKIKSSKIDIDMKEVLKFEPELKKMAQVYEDYLIQQREPGYPTPTSQGIDLNKTLKPDPAFDVTPEMLDINPDDIPF
jgi:hypothetical protein